MNAPPTTLGPPAGAPGGALPGSGRASFGQASASATSMRWSALHDAAALVATLAGLAPEAPRVDVRNFPAMIRDVGGWRRQLAEDGIEDITVVMESGLAALLAANGRGVDVSVAALALWQEFYAARGALLALIPTHGALGPRRSA